MIIILKKYITGILLLAGNGRVLYSGPRSAVLRYFARLDERLNAQGALICSSEASPPEFLMDLAALSTQEMIDALVEECVCFFVWQNWDYYD